MMNFIAPQRTQKARISEAEQARRREAVEHADANNRIEGVYRTPESNEIFDAFIRGEIDAHELTPRLQLLQSKL